MLNNYALIIGVEDYGQYDRSTGRAPGTSDVAGAREDARAHVRQCLAMGFAAERIRVLASPAIPAAELDGAIHTGEATRSEILAGVRWLAEAVAGAPAAGLLTFSGHGAETGGVVLFPSDLTGTLAEAVHVAEVRATVAGAPGDITMLLDCCRRAPAGADEPSTSAHDLRERARALAGAAGNGVRVIAACQPDQVAASSRFGGVRQGAFTWAITSAMDQWRTVQEGGVARRDVSYGELTSRARRLLEALSFAQVPSLSGPEGIEALPFLAPGAAPTSREPNAALGVREIDPGCFVLRGLLQGTWLDLAYVDSRGLDGGRWKISEKGAAAIPDCRAVLLETASQRAYDEFDAPAYDAEFAGWSDREDSPAYPEGPEMSTFAGPATTGTVALTVDLANGVPVALFWFNPTDQLVPAAERPIEMARVDGGKYEGPCYVGKEALVPAPLARA